MAALSRVYFDTCALNRPFDDQSQARIRLEAEAVEHLIGAVDEGRAASRLEPASAVQVKTPVAYELEIVQ